MENRQKLLSLYRSIETEQDFRLRPVYVYHLIIGCSSCLFYIIEFPGFYITLYLSFIFILFSCIRQLLIICLWLYGLFVYSKKVLLVQQSFVSLLFLCNFHRVRCKIFSLRFDTVEIFTFDERIIGSNQSGKDNNISILKYVFYTPKYSLRLKFEQFDLFYFTKYRFNNSRKYCH